MHPHCRGSPATIRLGVNTKGELGTKAKQGCQIDGKQFSAYETKAVQQSANVYLYAQNIDTSEMAKENVGKWACKKAGFSAEHIKVGDWRATKGTGIEGCVVLVMTDTDMLKLLRLGNPVDGTTNVKNAELVIDADDANVLMLGPDTEKVYIAASVALLKDCLSKAGQEYEEMRKAGPGAGGGVAAAEITAIRQQMQAGIDRQTEAAVAQAERTDAQFALIVEKANADSLAQQAQVTTLQRNLVAAHAQLTRQGAENALKANIAAKSSELENGWSSNASVAQPSAVTIRDASA